MRLLHGKLERLLSNIVLQPGGGDAFIDGKKVGRNEAETLNSSVRRMLSGWDKKRSPKLLTEYNRYLKKSNLEIGKEIEIRNYIMKPLWENVNDVSRLLRTIDKPVPCGALADTDIWDAIYRGEIYISPFHSENLTAADYNLQVSDIIISTRSGLPLKIYTSGQYRYVDVPANDTVLITTVESIFVGPQIMGTFIYCYHTVSFSASKRKGYSNYTLYGLLCHGERFISYHFWLIFSFSGSV